MAKRPSLITGRTGWPADALPPSGRALPAARNCTLLGKFPGGLKPPPRIGARLIEVILRGRRTRHNWIVSLLGTGCLLVLVGCQALNQQAPGGDGSVSFSTSPLSFGSIGAGDSKTLADSISNTTSSDVTVSTIHVSDPSFQVTGVTLPLTIPAGQSASFSVKFQPAAQGTFSATASFANSGGQSLASLPVSGKAVSGGQLTLAPSSLNFGNVLVGSNKISSVILSNSGAADLTLSQAALSGAGFSASSLQLPLTLHPGDTASMTVTFAPPAAGNFTGKISFNTDANDADLPLSGTGVTQGLLSANPASLAFGSVQVGSNSSLSETLTNTGGAATTISQATVTGAGFSITGLSLPVTLNPGQAVTFHVKFSPTNPGTVNGSVSVVSDASNSPLSIPLSGTGLAQGSLTSSPASFNFGNVKIGSPATINGTLTNTGGSSLTISAATVTGAGFSISGLSLPLTLSAGQGTSFKITFNPSVAGNASGTATIQSDGSNPTLNIPLAGTGVTPGTLSPNPSSVAFGNVQVGTNSTKTETLTNTGGSSLTISAANVSGTGFSISGLTLPLTLTAGQNTSFTVKFAPTVAGNASGSVVLTSDGSNPSLTIPLSGTGVTQGTLSPNPSSLAFGNVQVGHSSNLSETLTNTGGSSVTITQANVSGSAFSISGLTLPATLNPSQSVTFTATFTPTATGSASGSISVVSNASNSPLSIPLSGTGTAQGQLAVTPSTLNFGNVTVGSSAQLNGTLTASVGSVTVSSATIDNSEFTLSGITFPKTIAAGNSATFTVTFTPTSAGTANASLTFTSNASNSPTVESLTGVGKAGGAHSVDVSWDAASEAIGYNVYRGTVSGGPYTMLNTSMDTSTTYTDTSVVAGQTYYYVATAMYSGDQESGYSNEAQAVIPNP